MATIRCTNKLLNKLRIKPTITQIQPPSLSDWHANLLLIDRKKYVLFTNDQTLYSFLIYLAKKSLSSDFGKLFRLGLLKSLISDGFDDRQVKHLLGCQWPIIIAKTSSRSILGSMNDLASHIKYMVHAMGGLTSVDLSEISRELNCIPMGAIKYNFAIEELKQRLFEIES